MQKSKDYDSLAVTMQNRVVDFFSGKTILITGATGFVGKVLAEKLLRCCNNLEKIYVIIRGKKGKSAEERLGEVLDGPLFDCVKKQHGEDIVKKIEAISGDVSAPDLGLSPKDRQKLIEETEIVYHSAATVKFDDPLKETVLLNVRGTKLMLNLGKECKKLKVFSYVSTAYCHEDQEVLYEKFYPPSVNPHTVINLCEMLNDKALEKIAIQLRGLSVNNYTFSKALAESLVEEQVNHLPVIIQRPSAILPMWKDPIPGWTDNLYGPAGLLVGAGKGVIRTMYAREDIFVDCVPVDMVANALILTAYDFCTYGVQRVYNVTASELVEEIGITARRVIDMGKDIIKNRVAFNIALWYPNGSLKKSKIHHYIDFFLVQLLPAILIDTILFIVGVKPFLLKVQKKVWKGYQMFEYYANRKWNFDNTMGKKSRAQLNEVENEMFKVDAKGFDVYEYFVQCFRACKRYIMKEPDEDASVALRRMELMRLLDVFCKIVFFVGLAYFLCMKIF